MLTYTQPNHHLPPPNLHALILLNHIPSEVTTTRIRSRRQTLGAFVNWMCVFTVVQIPPIAIDRIDWRTFIISRCFARVGPSSSIISSPKQANYNQKISITFSNPATKSLEAYFAPKEVGPLRRGGINARESCRRKRVRMGWKGWEKG